MVAVETPVRQVDSVIALRFRQAAAKDTLLTFGQFRISLQEQIVLRNLTSLPFFIPQLGISYHDWGGKLSYLRKWASQDVLQPGRTTTLPVSLEMDRKKHFRAGGYLILHTPDHSHTVIVFTGFRSTYSPAEHPAGSPGNGADR